MLLGPWPAGWVKSHNLCPTFRVKKEEVLDYPGFPKMFARLLHILFYSQNRILYLKTTVNH